MRTFVVVVLGVTLAAFGAASKTLDIYLIDVESGNATLFVSPSGESLLIDTGNGGAAAARDAGRIMAAMKDAGVTRAGVHRAGNVHRQYDRRSAERHTRFSDSSAAGRAGSGAATGAQRAGVLDQGLRPTGRNVHGDQRAE
jgi:hypothetical protein